ncbi:MAG: hypothetical protein HYY93_05790 [Planctomycetes bacterium]|nr:hypothetical protein [Planctomycetota bacterium]
MTTRRSLSGRSIVRGLLVALAVLASPLWLAAQDSQSTINVQGDLKFRFGNAPVNGATPMSFALYSTSTGGTALFTESHSVGVDNGHYFASIGSQTAGGIPESHFMNASLYLGITVGTDSEMSPRIQISSSAFALNAMQVNNASGTQNIGTGSGVDTINIGNGGGADVITLGAAGTTTTVDGTFVTTGTVTFANLTTTDGTALATGTAADAVTIDSSTGGDTISIAGTGSTDADTINIDAAIGGDTINIAGAASTDADTINIGTSGADALTIGNTAAASLTLNTGTAFTLNGAAATTYAIGAATTTGTITIGGTAQTTGALTLGQSTVTNTINIGSAISRSGRPRRSAAAWRSSRGPRAASD